MMKIKIGILKSQINTDNPNLIRALMRLYTFKIPGAEFSAAYRRGHWDGKQRYLNAKGVFRTGLLPRILLDLEKIGCTPDVEYSYNNTKKIPKFEEIANFSYYSFQKDLLSTALENKRGVIKAPTGSGKTLIMAGLVQALAGKQMVILFNAKQLLTQTYEFLTDTCGFKNVGLCFGEGYINGDIMLCTVQSIDKILDTHLDTAEVLMVDEVHEFANGKTTLAAINSFSKAEYRFGLTATPPSDDIPKFNLEGAFGPVWQNTSTSGLVEEGKLSKPLIQLIKTPNTSGEDEYMSYEDVYNNFIIRNEDRNNKIIEIVNSISNSNNQARILILVKQLEHAQLLNDLLPNSYRLWGDDALSMRYKTITKFLKEKSASVLIGTKVLQTGINIEEITHFINARGLKSEIATLQAMGRALRRHHSKQQVYIYDFLDSAKYLKTHSNKRKKYYLKEGHEVTIL